MPGADHRLAAPEAYHLPCWPDRSIHTGLIFDGLNQHIDIRKHKRRAVVALD